jgi:hypothetical protein
MQQRIRFCSTADGARIAYATVGTGPAVVVASAGISHLELEWEEPRVREFWGDYRPASHGRALRQARLWSV